MPNPESNQKPSFAWLEKTACKRSDQVLFFGRRLTDQQIRQRNALCNSCEVKQECLDNAMYYGDLDTYRAGKTPEGLREEWRRRGQQQERKRGK